MHIVKLQHKLSKNRLEATNSSNEEGNYSRVVARTARLNNDIDKLLKRDTTPLHVSQILGIPIDVVNARVGKLERDEKDRREFLQTGDISSGLETGGYVATFR